MKKSNFILYLFLCSYCLGTGAAYQYGANAKEVSLSGAMVAVYNKGFNTFTNPSFLSHIQEPEWGFSYFIMSLDRSIQTMSYSRPVPPEGAISLSFLRVGVDDIKLTDFNNNPLGTYNHWQGYGKMSFAVKLGKASLGTNLKLFINELKKQNLEDYPAKGLGLDIGFNYKAGNQFVVGLFCENVTSQYKWGETTNKIEEEISMTSKLGFSYSSLKNYNIMMQLDFNENEYERFRIGAEYMLNNLSKPFVLRFGIKEDNNNEVNFLYYLGFGTSFKIFNAKKLNLDYALDPGLMHEGMSHIFSFSISSK